MRLTRAGEYAVRCMLCLARAGKGVAVSRQEVAAYGQIPDAFLAKIVQRLSRLGIIEIRQGAKGGYKLLLEPKDLTLLAVIEAMIGPIYLNDCVLRPESCHASPGCSVNRVWTKANEGLRETLRAANFAQLIAEEDCCLVPFPLASLPKEGSSV